MSTVRKNRKRVRRNAGENKGYAVTVVPRGLLGPPRVRVSLCFQKLFTVNQATIKSANEYFSATNMYDVDPRLSSSVMPGFTEWSGLYRFYRVNRFRATCVFFPNEGNQFIGALGVLNANPGFNSGTYTAQMMLAQPSQYIKWRAIPNSSNAVYQVHLPWCDVSKFAGVRYTGQNDSFSGPTNGVTAPVNNLFIWVGVSSFNAMSTGCNFQIVIENECEFFELQAPPT